MLTQVYLISLFVVLIILYHADGDDDVINIEAIESSTVLSNSNNYPKTSNTITRNVNFDCNKGQYFCPDYNQCILDYQLCVDKCLSEETPFKTYDYIYGFRCSSCEEQDLQSCNGECMPKYQTCNGVCLPDKWKCKGINQCIEKSTWRGSNLCNGIEDCSNGSDEADCPVCDQKFEEEMTDEHEIIDINDYEVHDCNGNLICDDQPCDGVCLNSLNKLCDNEKCIKKEEPCNGTCTDFLYNTFCPGEQDKCIMSSYPCHGDCISPEAPISKPFWSLCTSHSLCDPTNGPEVFDGPLGAHYMCNGMCIPVYIPCNNICVEEVVFANSKADMFGPLTCSEIPTFEALRQSNFKNLKPRFSNSWCLLGSMPCNGTCTIDPRLPLLQEIEGPQKTQCVEVCDRTREWPCNGTCISSEESCQGKCKEGRWKCREADKCIHEDWVCNAYPNCDDGSDEEDCPTCGIDETWVCDGKAVCQNYSIPCNGDCKDFSTHRCGDNCLPQEVPCDGKCPKSRIPCPDFSKCLYKQNPFNDGHEDCPDGADERIILTDAMEIKEYGQVDSSDLPVRICHGSFVNASAPCDGMCWEDYWQSCPGNNGKCTRKYSFRVWKIDTNGGGYFQLPTNECSAVQPSKSHKSWRKEQCQFKKTWICNGNSICSDEPCPSLATSNKTCPTGHYLCEQKCHPNFLSCNQTCLNGGFLCEQLGESWTLPLTSGNITFNTFEKIINKRFTHFGEKQTAMDLLYFIDICTTLHNGINTNIANEFCCLPPHSQCDGIIECKKYTNVTDEDNCLGCRNGLGRCEGTLICLDHKCKGNCMEGLVDCNYGGESLIQCSPSIPSIIKTENNPIDCADWAKRAANLPPIFAACHDWSRFDCNDFKIVSNVENAVLGNMLGQVLKFSN